MFESLKKKLSSMLGLEKTETKKSKKKKKEAKKPVKKAIKKVKEKKKPMVEEPKEGFFSKLTERFSTSEITKEQVHEFFDELEISLLENNVALEVVDAIREKLVASLEGKRCSKNELQKTIIETIKESLSDVLIEPPNLLEEIKKKNGPYVIVFFGINGSGKTTSVAKMAYYLKKNKISSVLVAGDTFRAASIEQLELHGSKLNIPVIKQTYGSDPAAVAFDGIKYAEKNKISCVLIDTAGRMYTKENLMREMEKIIRVAKPDLKLFVGESIAGNDAIEQARTFNETVNIDGMILTKADVDEKGGAPLSVSYITKKPIYFLGMGQTYDDLVPFKKDKILKNLGLE